MQFLRSDHRETLLKIEPHLVTKTTRGAGASAVAFLYPVINDMLNQI